MINLCHVMNVFQKLVNFPPNKLKKASENVKNVIMEL